MFHIVLFAPQIPPNTGNIIRLSANTGATLHLVEPLGFSLDEKSVRRAGLDYHMLADVHIHKNLDACIAEFDTNKIYAITRYGDFSIFEAQFNKVMHFYLDQKLQDFQNLYILNSIQTKIISTYGNWKPFTKSFKCRFDSCL